MVAGLHILVLGETYRSCQVPTGCLGYPLRAYGRRVRLRCRGVPLHELAVDDAIQAHQRPKLERYVTASSRVKPARYLEDTKRIQFGEIHAFVGGTSSSRSVTGRTPRWTKHRRRMEASPTSSGRGPNAVFYEIMRGYRGVCPGGEGWRTTSRDGGGGVRGQRRGLAPHTRNLPRGRPVPPGHKPLVGALEQMTESDVTNDPEERKQLRRLQDRSCG